MKPKYLTVFFFFVAMAVVAQTNVPPVPAPAPGPTGQGLLLALIPVIVPLIVAALKYFIQFLPSWSLPIIASALGELINYISGLAGGPTTSVLNGLVLGAAGTGLREIVDQVKGKIKPATTAAVIACAGLLCGCKTGPNPLLNPTYLTTFVADSTGVGLEIYPQARPDVALARDVICSEAAKTNVNPNTIVTDLQAAGITNSNAKVIVDSSLIAYNTVLALIGTNVDSAEPYLVAICNGLTQAVPSNPNAARRASKKHLPPHL